MAPTNNTVFPNSIRHRKKIRAWMAILTTFPCITSDQFTSRIPSLLDCINEESVPSTRIYIEWFLVLGLVKHKREENLRNLYNRLLEFSMPTGAAISILSIVYHVGRCLEGGTREAFFGTIFDRLMPWFLHNNHMVRLYVLYVYKSLWSIQRNNQSMPDVFVNTAAFIEQNEHCNRFIEKLKRDYYMSAFHAIRDYNVQTIFFTLPQSLGIAESELISMYTFKSICGERQLTVPLGPMLTVDRLFPEPSPDLGTQLESKPEKTLQDFQQKIDPWDMGLLDQDLTEITKSQIVTKKKESFDLIVVASLVDKLPNLAGLSRTCEIMGVGALVIPDLKAVENPEFLNVSMTSEKWLDIIEVKATALEDYLNKLRMQGYRILAIEQSSQSISLADYVFPKKCALVLGNEKEGVPAEILHVVDDCLEIPQFGMIRSLNVHVCGSLVIWEARKQKILQ